MIDFKNSYDRHFRGGIAHLDVSREAFDEIIDRIRPLTGGSLVGCSTDWLWENDAKIYAKGTDDISAVDCRFASTFPKVDITIPLSDEERESLQNALNGIDRERRTPAREKQFLDLSKSYNSYRNPCPVATLYVKRDAFEEIVHRASEQAGGETLKDHSIDELLGDVWLVYAKCDERLENIELWFKVEEQGVDVQIPLDDEEIGLLREALKGAGREDNVRERLPERHTRDDEKKIEAENLKKQRKNRYDFER